MWTPAATIVAPASDAVTLDAVKQFLRLEAGDTTYDAELGGYIAGAIDDVQAVTGTRLITQTVEVRADSFADLLRLPIGPVQSIASFTYLDTTGSEQELTAGNDFEIYGNGLQKGLRPLFGSTWPAGAIRASSIAVSAVVGYGDDSADLPQSIYVTLLRMVKGLFDGEPLVPTLYNYRIWL